MDGLFARLAARAIGSPQGERPRMRHSPAPLFAAPVNAEAVAAADPMSRSVGDGGEPRPRRPKARAQADGPIAAGADERSQEPAVTRVRHTETLTTIEKTSQLVVGQQTRAGAADDRRAEPRAVAMRPATIAARSQPPERTSQSRTTGDTQAGGDSREAPAVARRGRVVASRKAPAARRESRRDVPQKVEVTIGVIEVRAVTPPTVVTQVATPAPRVQPGPTLTLDAYLAERSEGRR